MRKNHIKNYSVQQITNSFTNCIKDVKNTRAIKFIFVIIEFQNIATFCTNTMSQIWLQFIDNRATLFCNAVKIIDRSTLLITKCQII